MAQEDEMRMVKIAGLSVAMIGVCLGSLGCDKILKAAKKSQKHAAIAYDEKTGGWGYSHDHLTAELAKKAATAKCSTCTVRLTWNQGCGALAQSESKKEIMTTAQGSNRPAAESAAKKECVDKGGGTCKVLVYACNSTN
ncbi:MAG: hypothetical protein AMXMBFR56_27000 [Polyangiaceae bacterium]